MPECGVIMPISATTSHSEKHWLQVLGLVHRTIKASGMEPANVWAGEATDRISERIVANIFSHEIIVADISDLNPNVMLELGLRLASKKPTIVISDSTGSIPFDIRDFSILKYPDDLNIVEMESFMTLLSETIKEKLEAFQENRYSPFLGSIVVDVATPETRSVPLNEIVLDRLEQIGNRLSRLEKQGKPTPPPVSYGGDSVVSSLGGGKYRAYYTVPIERSDTAIALLSNYFEQVHMLGKDTRNSYISAVCEAAKSHVADSATDMIMPLGAKRGVPQSMTRL